MASKVRALTSEERTMVQGVVDRMKAAREAHGISREEAAYKLGVDFSTIGRWERFATKDGPPLWAVVGYARLAGEPVAKLLGEDVPRDGLEVAVMQMLFDELKRFDRDWSQLHARISEVIGENAGTS